MDESAYRKNQRIDQVATYLFGKVEQLLADYARSQQISEIVLTRRVAELLYAQTGGTPLGAKDHLPPLRGEAAQNGSRLAEMEVAGGPRSNGAQQIVDDYMKKEMSRIDTAIMLAHQGLSTGEISKKMGIREHTVRTYFHRAGFKSGRKPGKRAYAPGTHWTQKKKNRAKLMAVIRSAQKARQNGG